MPASESTRLLERYPLLRELAPARFSELFDQTTVMRLPAGTVIFDENQPCQGFPLLLSGSVVFLVCIFIGAYAAAWFVRREWL